MQTAKTSSGKEMKCFAEGLMRDQDPVEGTLQSGWINEQTEG
jgi:hypothetical protein